MPLTVCPLSNHRLQLPPRFFCGENAVRQLLSRGVKVTVNSDDPAYFFMGNVSAAGRACDASAYDGFLASNYVRTVRDCGVRCPAAHRPHASVQFATLLLYKALQITHPAETCLVCLVLTPTTYAGRYVSRAVVQLH